MEAIQKKYNENYQKIKKLAETFVTLIIKTRKMCTDTKDAQLTLEMIKRLFDFAENLKQHLEKIKNFENEISKFSQDSLYTLATLERESRAKNQENERLKDDLVEKQQQMAAIQEKIDEILKSKKDFDVMENEIKQRIKKLENGEKNLTLSQWAAAGIALGASIAQFSRPNDTRSLDVVDIAVDGHDAIGIGLNGLVSALEVLNQKVKNLDESLKFLNNNYEIVCEEQAFLEKRLKECSDSLLTIEKTMKKILQKIETLETFFDETTTLISILNSWINFLHKLEVQAERIPEDLDYDDEMFQEITKKIYNQLHIYLNTSDVNILENEACALASNTKNCMTFEAELLPEKLVLQKECTISDILKAVFCKNHTMHRILKK